MKFRPEPWAEAFINAAGSVSAAEEALGYLRVYCRTTLMLPGVLSGRNDAARLGQCIKSALAVVSGREAAHGTAGKTPGSNGSAGNSPAGNSPDAADYASRFVQLILRKDCLHNSRQILREIEKAINKKKKIEEVIVETAEEAGEGTLAAVREKALHLTGAKEIKLITRVIPDLIGGLRLRWGGIVFDGSIKRRLEKMTRDISVLGDYSGQEA